MKFVSLGSQMKSIYIRNHEFRIPWRFDLKSIIERQFWGWNRAYHPWKLNLISPLDELILMAAHLTLSSSASFYFILIFNFNWFLTLLIRGRQWNSNGDCGGEVEPIVEESHLAANIPMVKIVESVISEMKTPVSYLNVTRLTAYRKDGHPASFRPRTAKSKKNKKEKIKNDCSHWCLPGVPDAWNELLLAMLVIPSWTIYCKCFAQFLCFELAIWERLRVLKNLFLSKCFWSKSYLFMYT